MNATPSAPLSSMLPVHGSFPAPPGSSPRILQGATPNPTPRLPAFRPTATALATTLLVACGAGERGPDASMPQTVAEGGDQDCSVWSEFRNIIGDDSPLIRRVGEGVWVWAGGDADGPGAEWFEFTGSPISPGELQYGIGRDRIPSIDAPVFTTPDDPLLLGIPPSRYRACERPETIDEIMVIGHVVDGEARAYPTALLDRHEIVNDVIGGEVLAIGWCPLADLASVHSRAIPGGAEEFGVSGYVYRNTFLIYDRETLSLWYPFDEEGWTAVGGPRRGEIIPFLSLPEPLPLGEWRARHPGTLVLIGGEEGVFP